MFLNKIYVFFIIQVFIREICGLYLYMYFLSVKSNQHVQRQLNAVVHADEDNGVFKSKKMAGSHPDAIVGLGMKHQHLFFSPAHPFHGGNAAPPAQVQLPRLEADVSCHGQRGHLE